MRKYAWLRASEENHNQNDKDATYKTTHENNISCRDKTQDEP